MGGEGRGEKAFTVRPWPLSKIAWRTCSFTLTPAVTNSLMNRRLFTLMWAVTMRGQGTKKQNQAKQGVAGQKAGGEREGG